MPADPLPAKLIGVIAAVSLGLLVLAIGFALNAMTGRKRVRRLPDKRPWFCLLPKYYLNLRLDGPPEEWGDEVHRRVARLGFEVQSETEEYRTYARGNHFADFKAEAVRTVVVVRLPVTNPTPLGLQYASRLGVAFDTGDLWKVADSIRKRLEKEAGAGA